MPGYECEGPSELISQSPSSKSASRKPRGGSSKANRRLEENSEGNEEDIVQVSLSRDLWYATILRRLESSQRHPKQDIRENTS